MKLTLKRVEAEKLEKTLRWVLAATRSTDDERNTIISIINKISIALKFPSNSNKIEFEIEK